MKLEKLNQWLSFAANVGVLLGIVFLVLEMQQNTAAVQSATVQAITDSSADALHAVALYPDLAQLRVKGEEDYGSLSDIERFQFGYYTRARWIRMQSVFMQNELGVLLENVWSSYYRIICNDFAKAGVRDTWVFHKPVLGLEFIAVVESCIVD